MAAHAIRCKPVFTMIVECIRRHSPARDFAHLRQLTSDQVRLGQLQFPKRNELGQVTVASIAFGCSLQNQPYNNLEGACLGFVFLMSAITVTYPETETQSVI